MSGECEECGEHCLDCRCTATKYIAPQVVKYGLFDYTMKDHQDPYCSLSSKKVDDYLQDALKCVYP